jgi:hypothetical protein
MQAARNTRSDFQKPDAKASGALPLKNPRHEKLAREYASGATQAEAWRSTFGRDPSTGNASRTFARAEIHARIEYLRAEWNRMAGISLAALQSRYLRIADANVLTYCEADERGRMRVRDLTKLPHSATAPISELNIDKDGGVKLKLADKLHALDSLAKTIGAFAASEQESGLSLETLVIQSMTTVQRSDPASPSDVANAAPVENQIETRTGVRRVRLSGVPIQRWV